MTAATEPIPEEPLLTMRGKRMLRIDIHEGDQWHGQPLYEAIIHRAAALGVAGGTAYRGILGYGRHHHVERHEPFDLWRDDPVTVVIVDESEKVIALIAALQPMLTGGRMITISDVTLVTYAEGEGGGHPAPQEPKL